MLAQFEQRRKDLLEQLAVLGKDAAEASGKQRDDIDAAAWRVVERIELYRNNGPLAFFNSPQPALQYLQHLRDETDSENEADLFNEVLHALDLLATGTA